MRISVGQATLLILESYLLYIKSTKVQALGEMRMRSTAN